MNIYPRVLTRQATSNRKDNIDRRQLFMCTTYRFIYLFVYACVRVRACVRACVHACVHARACTCTCACVHACICMCVCACMRACVRACMHACTRACAHAVIDVSSYHLNEYIIQIICIHRQVCYKLQGNVKSLFPTTYSLWYHITSYFLGKYLTFTDK